MHQVPIIPRPKHFSKLSLLSLPRAALGVGMTSGRQRNLIFLPPGRSRFPVVTAIPKWLIYTHRFRFS